MKITYLLTWIIASPVVTPFSNNIWSVIPVLWLVSAPIASVCLITISFESSIKWFLLSYKILYSINKIGHLQLPWQRNNLSEHKEPISHICCDEGQSEIFLWKDIAHMSDPVNPGWWRSRTFFTIECDSVLRRFKKYSYQYSWMYLVSSVRKILRTIYLGAF